MPPYLLALTAALAAPPANAAPSFERDVRPILKAYCFDCHGEDAKPKGGLDLRLRRLMAEGGDSGPAITPGKRVDSILFTHVSDGTMPPGKKKLTPGQVAVIGRWIDAGAPVAKSEPEKVAAGLLVTEEEKAFWSFQPVKRPPVPPTAAAERARTAVDALLLPKLREKAIAFSPDASKLSLIRRVTFDLTGLPPTPEEVEAFLADSRPDAYERLVDRLLKSPHYGERWGRHWLDVAGYADSEGQAPSDPVRADAWRYRDYVVRSLNADKPFDRFIVEQLAGDELVAPPYDKLPPEEFDKLLATGFLRMAPDGTGALPAAEQLEARNAVVAETIKIVSTSLMGLSLGCAQCHNHRYDPISQADYYRVRAVFEPALNPQAWKAPGTRSVAMISHAEKAEAEKLEAEAEKILDQRAEREKVLIEETFQAQLKKVPADKREAVNVAFHLPPAQRTAEQEALLKSFPYTKVNAGTLYLYNRKHTELKDLAAKAEKVRAGKPQPRTFRVLTESPADPLPVTRLFARGDITAPKEAVAPGSPAVLDAVLPLAVPEKKTGRSTGRRLAFARWLTDPRHPLVARVLVNRVWMHHFGKGLVATPAEFGAAGERPSHPELLDWLASEFVQGGWSLKRLHRVILTSTAYRQSSKRDAARDAADPDNRLLSRQNLRRLEAEAVRDAVLAASGKLLPSVGGPPVSVIEDEVGQYVLGIEMKNGEGRQEKFPPVGPDEFRRSLYVQVRRSRPLTMLDTFDWARLEPNCEIRSASTVAPQALVMLNSQFLADRSADAAARVARDAGDAPARQADRAWRLAFGRAPTPAESADAVAFLSGRSAAGDKNGLADLCHALFASNAFIYVD
jgi:mono/diheme cytochrome c family protein